MSEERKMTAVEWYSKEHLILLVKLENKEISIGEYVVKHSELLEQAKQMEKEQIIEAHLDGQSLVSCKDEYAEQYYNQTYKNK
jgi:hypothetical protein